MNSQRISVDAELEPYDFPPEDVLGGDPQPRGVSVTENGPDGFTVTTGIFALEPGVIRADVPATETVHVLEGEIAVAFDSGEEFELGPGDVVVFPAGTVTTRTVKSSYKELYVHSTPA